MTVDIIVVCFNSDAELLRLCVESVSAAMSYAGVEGSIMLVDNASDVPPPGALRLPENVGFGRAVNIGVARSGAEYILMLNPDASVSVDSLRVFLDAASVSPRALIGGWLENDGRVQSDAYMQWDFSVSRAVRRRRFARGLASASDVFPVDKVCGGALFASTALLRELGPFDPRFFLYGEDADLSRRASSCRIPLLVARSAVVDHVAASSQKTHGRLVEQARADAAIRLVAYHSPLWVSYLQRFELVIVTLVGAVAGGKSSSSRRARLARVRQVRRWGLRRDVGAFGAGE